MKDGGLASLRKSLVTHYDRLKRRLSARLGNDELAGDALQDAYLKLDGVAAPEAVRQPEAYIYRMAFHIAADYARSGDERLTRAEADEILGLTPDAAPGPAQIAEDRQALQTLMRALERMPERQREILLAARLDGVTQKELAARHGISVRMVERELQHAQAYCRARLPYSRSDR
ncbi:RNA polymerase sigma factor [Achromobacter sp. Marseille-Q0513]|uniref:RNA polymerase sigma factor n=1 Tax=unclassified Achromobacter TaxID=2626865 RepID=UPI00131A036A|nr:MULTISPECIES: RNA polymerase sigma factor [unclassified Achromobacter]MBR8656949.1 RNA polymerase sigma factor [Achromobacter sp. Marseille-Q0513]